MALFARVRDWFGVGGTSFSAGAHGDHGPHGHTHGVVDPSITTTSRGIWAVKWSFVILAITAAFQVVIVVISGSVALLADTIHNFGDAVTAVPLWIAFALARRPVTRTFTHGYGRVEDIAGVVVVLIILFSAVMAGYQSIGRLIVPVVMDNIGWVAVAGVVGFIGNEIVAVFRIRVGREINSAALIADGYHARTDGFTSLAVVAGAIGVAVGLPLADPIIGLVITVAILGIVWQSGRAIFRRMLDGVEPGVVDEIQHAVTHVPEVLGVESVKARWIGHRMSVEVTIAVDRNVLFAVASTVSDAVKRELFAHLPALGSVSVSMVSAPEYAVASHHHAPAPVRVRSRLADGLVEIADTPDGERFVLRLAQHAEGLNARVLIQRPEGIEELALAPTGANHHRLESLAAPAEPHAFKASLVLTAREDRDEVPFEMSEPLEHTH